MPPAPPRTPTDPALSARHREVLREAMRLIAERGYGGASLRELARRVGMQQPSLYHYFRSKEEMVQQVLDNMGALFELGGRAEPPAELERVPEMLAQGALYLYQRTDWPLFVRFLFALSPSEPRFRKPLRDLFVDRGSAAIERLMRPFVERGELDALEAEHFARMVMNAVGLLMIEQVILYPGEDVRDPREFADFVARFARAGLSTIRRSAE